MAGGSKGRKGGGGGSGGGGTKAKRSQPKNTRSGLGDKVSPVNKSERRQTASRAIRRSVAKQSGAKRSGTQG